MLLASFAIAGLVLCDWRRSAAVDPKQSSPPNQTRRDGGRRHAKKGGEGKGHRWVKCNGGTSKQSAQARVDAAREELGMAKGQKNPDDGLLSLTKNWYSFWHSTPPRCTVAGNRGRCVVYVPTPSAASEAIRIALLDGMFAISNTVRRTYVTLDRAACYPARDHLGTNRLHFPDVREMCFDRTYVFTFVQEPLQHFVWGYDSFIEREYGDGDGLSPDDREQRASAHRPRPEHAGRRHPQTCHRQHALATSSCCRHVAHVGSLLQRFRQIGHGRPDRHARRRLGNHPQSVLAGSVQVRLAAATSTERDSISHQSRRPLPDPSRHAQTTRAKCLASPGALPPSRPGLRLLRLRCRALHQRHRA